MLFCLLTFLAVEGEFARYQVGVLGGVLARKSYIAIFVYFNACVLGVLLRDNIAHSWASVLPHFRQKHLLVTTFCPFLAMATWMLLIVQAIGVELNIALASVLTTASVATIALAYRRWCRADLD